MHQEGFAFGEKVLYKTKPTKDANVVLDARWKPGVFLGKTWVSTINRVIIDPRRVKDVRAVQRVPRQNDGIEYCLVTFSQPQPSGSLQKILNAIQM